MTQDKNNNKYWKCQAQMLENTWDIIVKIMWVKMYVFKLWVYLFIRPLAYFIMTYIDK